MSQEESLEVWEPSDEQLAEKAASFEQPRPLFAESWGNVLVPWRRELMEFLIPHKSDKGTGEGERTITIWWARDRWKASLRAKDGNCVAFFTGETLGELFFDLHLKLRTERCVWKEEKPRGRPKG